MADEAANGHGFSVTVVPAEADVQLLEAEVIEVVMLVFRKKTYLFSFECQFNEDLLEFLVDKINAKLFKSVLLKDFKAINVQNAQCCQIL